ncbi:MULTISPECIES: ROK family transcriptional regulator [unclassified Arthrobacter]|uniref:ROK family transcriptional regulator n=1 Tax=unclassified Arthrobacter TaxID=235627 RepID=UPI002DFAA451|nr:MULTISPECIES: ROK family transcriptional regulator [unclassified Arthrobacter]MEC5191125.1 putative NBD/HSP70 family sugar kinase [Arthrobacter sp. MP_M4]MEC5202296.1 putative NBD/HSP70 family sugar kinase [Arthrobacter sp. MP_M7]
MSEIRQPSPRRGTNLPRMGDFNLTVILDAIRRSPAGLSRVELAHIVGLSPQTISNISRRLLDQDLIYEAGKEGTGPGKPRTMLKLKSSGMYAVGVHLDPAVTTCVVLDLVGAVVKHSRIKTPAGTDPGSVIDTIAAEIKQIIAASGVDPARIAGLGVAAPGPIDLEEGTVVDPPLLPGWDHVPLRDALAAATGLTTIVDKDVTSAAVAETWAGGPSGSGSFVFMYMGTGIGCGIVLNDEVVRGTSGNAGEIGHIIVDPDGPLCDCGTRGCIKASCIPQVLVAQAVAAGVLTGPLEAVTGPAIQESITALCAAADAGDPKAEAIIDRSAVLVARAVSTITNALDVDRVVFGGPFWTCLSRLYLARIPELVRELSDTRKIHEIDVVGTGVGEDVGAIGAACLVLEHALAPRSQRLLLDG